MKLLLDTHAFLWWDANDASLPLRMREAIASPENEVFVSAASAWEICTRRASGKLNFGGVVSAAIKIHGFESLPITVAHAEFAGSLPPIHKDPFDRMLIAQAQLGGLTLVTVDTEVLRYPVARL